MSSRGPFQSFESFKPVKSFRLRMRGSRQSLLVAVRKVLVFSDIIELAKLLRADGVGVGAVFVVGD